MSYQLDPELVTVMAALAEQSTRAAAPARGDWKALRQAGEGGQAYLATLVPPTSGIQTATFHAASHDGTSVELRRRAPDEGTGTTLSEDVFAGLACEHAKRGWGLFLSGVMRTRAARHSENAHSPALLRHRIRPPKQSNAIN